MLPPQPREESASESKERVFSLKERLILFTVIKNNNNNNKSRVLLHASLVFYNTPHTEAQRAVFELRQPISVRRGGEEGARPLFPPCSLGRCWNILFTTQLAAQHRDTSPTSLREP